MTSQQTLAPSHTRPGAADLPAAILDTRSEIVRVALELFAEQGFAGTSLQEIADRLKFTKAALYYHFRSKEDLLSAVVEPLFAGTERVMDAPVSLAGSKMAQRQRLLEDYVDCLLAHRDVLGFLSRDLAVLGRPAIAQRVYALQERIHTAVAGSNLSQANKIRISFAFGGLQSAIVTHSDVSREELRGPVLEGIDVVLRVVSRCIAAENANQPSAVLDRS